MVATPAPVYPVRKGDLVGIAIHRSSTALEGGHTQETYWVIGLVERATRDGWAAEVSWTTTGGWTTNDVVRVPGRPVLPVRVQHVVAIPRELVADRRYLLDAVAGREFPDLDSARNAIRPYVSVPAQ